MSGFSNSISTRPSSRAASRSLQTENDDDEDVTKALIGHRSKPTLDVHIDRGFDIPLITKPQDPKTHTRPSSYISQADTGSFQERLIKHEPISTIEAHDRDDFGDTVFGHTYSEKTHRKRKSLRKGWRAGVVAAAIMTTTILLINLTLTIWASLNFEINGGIGNVYVGDCGVVNTWSTVLHVFINGLSSAMFSASNYTMQCLTAPTRKECDIAHARGDWLDIGVSSIRNLTRIRRSRRIAWGLLALSSIPIHFLYNSAIFKELDNNARSHNVVMVSPQFLEAAEIDFSVFPTFYKGNIVLDVDGKNVSRNASLSWGNHTTEWYDHELLWYNTPVASELHAAYHTDQLSFDELTPRECYDIYNTKILSGHSHLLLVMSGTTHFDNITSRDPQLSSPYPHKKYWPNWNDLLLTEADAGATPYFWDCGVDCPLNATGSIRGVQYDTCLAKRVEPNCKLQFSVQILAVVILCTFAKSALMLMTLWRQREETLLTFGDAIASWLDEPDCFTKGECLTSKSDVQAALLRRKTHAIQDSEGRQATARQDPGVQRWRTAVSNTRWRVTMVLCSAAVGATILLLVLIERNYYGKWGKALPVGNADDFGSVDPDLVLATYLPKKGAAGIISAVLVVNSPQLVLSFCYLLYNGLFTAMHLSHEYSGYAKQRKPLRVTTPRGTQRSTYWLQLPYIYGLPLIVASSILHWLVSQSIFIARIASFVDEEGNGGRFPDYYNEGSSDSEIGFSIAPIIACIVLATCMLLAAIGMGFRRLESNMSVAASCSFALAAATHRPKEDADASVLPVMWGEVPEMGSEDIGHCCFTSQEVVGLVPGRKYAGARHEFEPSL